MGNRNCGYDNLEQTHREMHHTVVPLRIVAAPIDRSNKKAIDRRTMPILILVERSLERAASAAAESAARESAAPAAKAASTKA